jgi:flavodoxin
MKKGRVLIVFFSRTGTTRKLARAIHAGLGGELMEITTRRYPRGLRGYLRAGMDAALGRAAPIRTKRPDASSYELIVVGTPVWNASLSAPVRTFLSQSLPRADRLAFFMTLGGSGARRVQEQMEWLCGKRPVASLALTEREVRQRNLSEKVENFVEELRKAIEPARAA